MPDKSFIECCNLHQLWLEEFRTACQSIGIFGQAYLRDIAASGCQSEMDEAEFHELEDRYVSGVFQPLGADYNHLNKIYLGPRGFEDLETFCWIQFHEGIHAIQSLISAATFATPYNRFVPIALCPRDYITKVILTERDAWSKEELFSTLLAAWKNQDEEKLKDCADPRHVQMLLQNISKDILKMENSGGIRLQQFYTQSALSDYEVWPDWDECPWKNDIDYVRLDNEDLWAFGNSLGFNSLYGHMDHVNGPLSHVLKEPEWQRLAALNQAMGIENESELMTFSEALRKHNMNQNDYMTVIRNS